MKTTALHLEGVLWSPGSEWARALEHLAVRFARVRPLDTSTIPTRAGTDVDDAARIADDCRGLAAWAGDDIDVARELTRFLDENLALYVRPDAGASRRMRALRAKVDQVVVTTALPQTAAETLLRHLGMLRSVDIVRGDLWDHHAIDEVLTSLGVEHIDWSSAWATTSTR